ncbi:hypothetical protein G7Y89_g5143 [Cudoniella acicularis]|uniref:C3H1-type domain-containing protein n=1 Tax=Cudoniella acicularis TaxID=354080 RepID=A0A8H4RN09_9HELO|nr:hypothetical protein G7Y89_g5143 [Cudoniella acicularis]
MTSASTSPSPTPPTGQQHPSPLSNLLWNSGHCMQNTRLQRIALPEFRVICSLDTDALAEVAIGRDSASRAGPQTPRTRACRYFTRTGYCRAGNDCPFLHDDTLLPGAQNIVTDRRNGGESSNSSHPPKDDGLVQDRRQAVTKPVASRVVPKPVPQAQSQDPREFQLGQIRRRFSPKETRQLDGAALLKFNLPPSDPDFPFEMTALECSLIVPAAYPKETPSLKVGNRDIPRGFTLNIEAGFDGLVNDKPEGTLLELMKALDRHLESFLSAPKADTVKLVPNKDTRHLSIQPALSVKPVDNLVKVDSAIGSSSVSKPSPAPPKRVENFTPQQKSEAAKRRENEVRQLEARMGRLPLYKKSTDGIAYTLPIEPRRRGELPTNLQVVKTIQLFVPLLYPLHPCRIQLEGVEPNSSKPVEKGFEVKASELKETTLMGHINYLAQNMHVLAKTVLEADNSPVQATQIPLQEDDLSVKPVDKGKGVEGTQDADRSHIQYIIRPPEWTLVNPDELSGSDSEDDYTYDSGDESSDAEGEVEVKKEDQKVAPPETHSAEHGTAISFPFIELYGIELLEVVILNISVKCERCKDITEIKGLKNGITKSESCRKCASPLTVLPLSSSHKTTLTSTAHSSPPALNAPKSTLHQESSRSAAKQPATSAANATKNSPSKFPKSNSYASHPLPVSPLPFLAERKKPSA